MALFCDCIIFIAGFRKTIAQRKFDGRMSQDEGKDRLPLEALAIIAERALQQVKDQRMHIFGVRQNQGIAGTRREWRRTSAPTAQTARCRRR